MAESFDSESTDLVGNLPSRRRHSIQDLTRQFEPPEDRHHSRRQSFVHRGSSVKLEEIGESYESLHSTPLDHSSRTADERDAIQKKTFTKWVNKHLKKHWKYHEKFYRTYCCGVCRTNCKNFGSPDAGKAIRDLFIDLQDGENLLSLLEVLSGETLDRQKGSMRFHNMQRVQTCLTYLAYRKIKLVNIQAGDIVDGNPKLTLGLIWTIILHFQVSEQWGGEGNTTGVSARDALLQWAKRVTSGYNGVRVTNFTTSWRDGLAFNALLHRYRPQLINWREVRKADTMERLDSAFTLAEREFGVTKLLDPEDVVVDMPDEKSLITYISSLYDALPDQMMTVQFEHNMTEYRANGRDFLQWVRRTTLLMQDRRFPSHIVELKQLLAELQRFKVDDIPPRLREKQRLDQMFMELDELFGETGLWDSDPDLTSVALDSAWNQFLRAVEERERALQELIRNSGSVQDLLHRLHYEIKTTSERLDLIYQRIEESESRINVIPPREMKEIVDTLVYELSQLESPIAGYFADVDSLKNNRHPQANDYYKQVFDLHTRRITYLQRCENRLLVEVTTRSDQVKRVEAERYAQIRTRAFNSCQECIEWMLNMTRRMQEMEFPEDRAALEEMLDHHRIDHRDVMDFRHQVDQCIARQAEVTAEDSETYCSMLSTLEEGYEQLRQLSTGRVLDLDSLIAFVRAATNELVWINDKEETEVTRDWSDVNRMDLGSLEAFYTQLRHDMELRETQFNTVYNQGTALINQQHPVVKTIEAYLATMHSQWDWLLCLTQCFQVHMQDAVSLQQFVLEARSYDQWIEKQSELLEMHHNRTNFSLEEGEVMLRELEELRAMVDRYNENLRTLLDGTKNLSPLWQRRERITTPITVAALCTYSDRNVQIRKGDDCVLIDNADQIKWILRTPEGVDGVVPSVVFRVPPPDERLVGYMSRLKSNFDRLRKVWLEKHRRVRFNMVLTTSQLIRSWDIKQFMTIEQDQSESIMRALNDDANILINELDPNDSMSLRLRDELKLANEHFYKLFQLKQKGPEPDANEMFDKKVVGLLDRLEESWRNLNKRVHDHISKTQDKLLEMINVHKSFEDALQSLDSEVSMVQELFRQIRDPSPVQRSRLDQLMDKWEGLWDLSRMYVERLKAIEQVLNGLDECNHIVTEHELSLGSFSTLPSSLEKLRGVHSQLLEMQLTVSQQQAILDQLAKDVGVMRQHVARTRFKVPDHPDVDRLEDEVQRVTVRWENVCAQIVQRLKMTEISCQIIMVYRSEYDSEIAWLDRVESTINTLRDPQHLHPEEFQTQLDVLLAEYSHLQERTQSIENVNREGGKYIREAKNYDNRLNQFRENLEDLNRNIEGLLRRTQPPPIPGSEVVAKELEDLNRRFSQRSSIVLERQNVLKVQQQQWKRQQQESEERERLERESQRRLEEENRRKAEAERIRLIREQEELSRLAAEREAERLRLAREAEEESRLRRSQEQLRLRAVAAAAEEADRLRMIKLTAEMTRKTLDVTIESRVDDRMAEELRRKKAEEAKFNEEMQRRMLAEKRLSIKTESRVRPSKLQVKRTEVEIPLSPSSAQRHKSRIHIHPVGRSDSPARIHIETPSLSPPILSVKSGGFDWTDGVTEETLVIEEITQVETATVVEHEEEMCWYEESEETRTQFYELEAVKHVQTGEILTFVEAIREGLLDLNAAGDGEFVDMVSGGKISLQEAVDRGYISQSLNDCLQTRYGLRDPNTGDELSLIEAIQRGVYDPEIRQLRDPQSGELLSLYEAVSKRVIPLETIPKLIRMGILKLPPVLLEDGIEQGTLNSETGVFTGRYSQEQLALKDALRNGYISLTQGGAHTVGLTLSDALALRFLDGVKGELSAAGVGGEKIPLQLALVQGQNIFNPNSREVLHTGERKMVTLNEAVVKGVINPSTSSYQDVLQRQSMSIQEAFSRGLIRKPLTLDKIIADGLIDTTGKIVDTTTKKRMTLLEAIADGFIDADVPQIQDPRDNEVVSIATALERGLLLPSGQFAVDDAVVTEKLSIIEAKSKGVVVEPVQYSAFDIKAIRDRRKGLKLSLKEAMGEGLVDKKALKIVDPMEGTSLTMADAAERNLVDSNMAVLFNSPSGFKNATVFEAVCDGRIDVEHSVLVDKRTGKRQSPSAAMQAGEIGVREAARLTAMLDVHPSLVAQPKSPQQIRKRLRSRPDASREDQIKVTLGEALKQGLIDARTQRFKQGGVDISLQEAMVQGIVSPSSEWIVPSRSAVADKVVEEKKSEKITETNQILSPKPVSGGQFQETLTTVKRLRTTETVSDGGPSSLSYYKSLTNVRGTLEVPVDGLHPIEAEKAGLLDLAAGTVVVEGAGKDITLEEAFELGILNTKDISIRDPISGAQLTLLEGMSRELIDSCGRQTDAKTGVQKNLQDLITSGVVKVAKMESAKAEDKINTKVIKFNPASSVGGSVISFTPKGTSLMEESSAAWSFNAPSGEVRDLLTDQTLTLDLAIKKGKMTPDHLVVMDVLTERKLSFDDAVKWGIVNRTASLYIDKKSGKSFSLQEAAKKGLITMRPATATDSEGSAILTAVREEIRTIQSTKELAVAGPAVFVDFSLEKVLSLGWYDESTGHFRHPDTKRNLTLKEAIAKGLFNPYESVVIDPSTGEVIPLIDAAHLGLVDVVAGVLVHPVSGERLSLTEAVNRGLIHAGVVPQPLDVAISTGRLDLTTGQVLMSDGVSQVGLSEALQKSLVDPNSVAVVNVDTGEQWSLQQATDAGLVDFQRGLITDPRNHSAVSFANALTLGLLKPLETLAGKRLEAVSAAMGPKSKVHSMLVAPEARLTTGTDVQLPLKRMGESRDLSDVSGKQEKMVKVITYPDGSEKGEYVEPNSGEIYSVKLHGDPYVTQSKTTVKSKSRVEAVELDPNAEFVGIDKVKDNRTGRVMSLAEAERLGIARVDKKGKEQTKTYAVFRSDLATSLKEGVIDPATGKSMSLQDAIHSRLFDVKNLTFTNPFTGESVDVVRAANTGLIDATLADVLQRGLTNPVNGETISMAKAVELGIVDIRTGKVLNPHTNTDLNWLDVLRPVYASLSVSGVYDPMKGYAVPITSAINEGLIDAKAGMYHNPITNDSCTLEEAQKRGLIDESTFKIITKPSIPDWKSGQKISLLEAVDKGLVDTKRKIFRTADGTTISIVKATKDGQFPSDISAKLKRVDQLKFAEALSEGLIDVTTNTFTDPDSGKKVSIAQALELGYIDTGSVKSFEGQEDKQLVNVVTSDEFDSNSGRLRDPKTGLNVTFLKAVEDGLINEDSLLYDTDRKRTMTLRNAIDRGILDRDGKYIDSNKGTAVGLKDAVKTGLIALIASPMLAGQAVAEAFRKRDDDDPVKFKFASTKGSLSTSRPSQSRTDSFDSVALSLVKQESTDSGLLDRSDSRLEELNLVSQVESAGPHDVVLVKKEERVDQTYSKTEKKVEVEYARLRDFADSRQQKIDISNLPLSKEESAKLLAEAKEIAAEVHQEKPKMENLKLQCHELTRLKAENVVGRDDLVAKVSELGDRWDSLANDSKVYQQRLEESKEFYSLYGSISHWLAAKKKMITVLGPVAADPVQIGNQLQQVHVLMDEFDGQRGHLEQLDQVAQSLTAKLHKDNLSDKLAVEEKVTVVTQTWNELMAKLTERNDNFQSEKKDLVDKIAKMEAAATVAKGVKDDISKFVKNIRLLDEDFLGAGPLSRDLDSLKSQKKQSAELKKSLDAQLTELDEAQLTVDQLRRDGFEDDADALQELIDKARGQITQMQEKMATREREADQLISRLDDLLSDIIETHAGLMKILGTEVLQKPITGSVDEIKQQVEDIKEFKDGLEPMGRRVESLLQSGRDMVKSAGPGTSQLEYALTRLADISNELKSRVSDREKKLDSALLGLSNYKDTAKNLQGWLDETEELMANQRAPSSDHKVVRAQLREQNLLLKLIDDKLSAIEGLKAMVDQFPNEKRLKLGEETDSIVQKYESLQNEAFDRKKRLGDTLELAEAWAEEFEPFLSWLDNAERKLQKLDSVPTDEDKLKAQMNDHHNLHEEIGDQRNLLDNIMELGTRLRDYVSDEDADSLAGQMSDSAIRYDRLGTTSEALEKLLAEMVEGVGAFLANTEDLGVWLDDMEIKIRRFVVIGVFTDPLNAQTADLATLAEEIANNQERVLAVVEEGHELCKHTSGDEAITLQSRLDSLRLRYADLSKRVDNRLSVMQEALPLAEVFHDSQQKLSDWLLAIGDDLARLDEATLDQQQSLVKNMEEDIFAFKATLERLNGNGARLSQLSPGEGTTTLEGIVSLINKRYDAVAQQVQRRSERLNLSKERSNEVIRDMDDYINWFQKAENHIANAGAASSSPTEARVQLKEQKDFNDDVVAQRGRVRDILSAGGRLSKDFSGDDAQVLQDKMDTLKDLAETVNTLSFDCLSVLEQALYLSEQWAEAMEKMNVWLSFAENELENAPSVTPSLQPDQIRRQQENNKGLLQSLQENKSLLDRINKTGGALASLCNDEDAIHIHDSTDHINGRFEAIRDNVRSRAQALDDALQQTSQFCDKLDGMLQALSNTASQVKNAEPIAAHPEKIRDQIRDNLAVVEEMQQRSNAYQNVKTDAADIISKADPNDPAVQEIEQKISHLVMLWDEISTGASLRGQALNETLAVAEKFWEELNGCAAALSDLEKRLDATTTPGVEPSAIQAQQDELGHIEASLHEQTPLVKNVKQTAAELLDLVGEAEKPEVLHRVNELDCVIETVTQAFFRRQNDLLEAMDEAMIYHELMGGIQEWLGSAEEEVAHFPPVSSSLLEIQEQIEELGRFKDRLDQHMIDVELLNQQAAELIEGTAPDQAMVVKKPLAEVNKRWDVLGHKLSDRQKRLEKALLQMGQFHQALDQLVDWIGKSDQTLSDIKPVPGDLKQIEIELAKHRVLQNDVHSHQSSVDTINDTGRKLVEAHVENSEATQAKLEHLNSLWMKLLDKLGAKHAELDSAKTDAESFSGQVQDWLLWLAEVDSALLSSKPVGGLPETAREQLDKFLLLDAEIEENRPKVENVVQLGEDYIAKSAENEASALGHSVKNLRQKWLAAQTKAADRRIKLEIALKVAEEFQEYHELFVTWLTNAEKILSALQPVSRLIEPLTPQMESHKDFQDELNQQREALMQLDKKGTQLKYFSQKQDVILIKNLLVSAQHRWDRVVSRSAERTRQLETGYAETKEFFDLWKELSDWLDESHFWLDEQQTVVVNNADKIKENLTRHKEFQRDLGAHQPQYDSANKQGKQLKDRAPKEESPVVQEMLNTLRDKWNAVSNRAIDRQRKLEESLLFSGQFKEALQALLDWLNKTEPKLAGDQNVHGDLDTVTNLFDQHKNFIAELKGRSVSVETVRKAAAELQANGDPESAEEIRTQVDELNRKWDTLSGLAKQMNDKFDAALADAEYFHKQGHMLLEWLSDMEMKLKYAGALPGDPDQLNSQLGQLQSLQRQFAQQQSSLDAALQLGNQILSKCHPDAKQPLRHWLTILQSRWDEVSSWSQQREERIKDQVKACEDQDALIDDLIKWLHGREAHLQQVDEIPIPEELSEVERLMTEHQEFQEDLRLRQPEIDEVTKGKRRPDAEMPPIATMGKDLKGKDQKVPQSKHAAVPDRSKHPKVRQVSDKWRQVWLLSMERHRKLQDIYNYLQELEKMKHFDFDVWRRRYVDWMQHKKSRVMDFFRRQDKDGDGKVTREEFIEGILQSKFPTNRLEMNAVADRFDKDRDGYIDYKEFINALRPDRETTQSGTDAEKIKSEVVRQVQMCMCHQPYKVKELGEGKYRFGDSQKLRLVRILRSTVMVRVGGGWVALDEFLVKNDPCRTKGRTNMELREKFILPEGASQTMQAFRVRNSPKFGSSQASSSGSGSTTSFPCTATPGPIMKIREKTERSLPLSRTLRTAPNRPHPPHSHGTPLSPTDSEVFSIMSDSGSSSGVLLSPDGRPASRRSIRGGLAGPIGTLRTPSPAAESADIPKLPSRPPSRAGSDISDISIRSRNSLGGAANGATPTRIPSIRGRKSVRGGESSAKP